MSGFNWVDLLIAVLLLLSMFISFLRGFWREVISLGVWILGLAVGLHFADEVGNLFTRWIQSTSLRYLVGFVLIFTIALLIGAFVNNLIHQSIHKAGGVSFTNRFLGIIFGAVRGVALVSILLLLVSMGSRGSSDQLKYPAVVKAARLVPYFNPVVLWLNTFLPDQMAKLSAWVKSEAPSDDIAANIMIDGSA